MVRKTLKQETFSKKKKKNHHEKWLHLVERARKK